MCINIQSVYHALFTKKTWKKIRGDFDSHTWNMCSSWNTSWTCWKTHKRYFIIYHLVLMSLPPPIKRWLIFSCSLYYHSKVQKLWLSHEYVFSIVHIPCSRPSSVWKQSLYCLCLQSRNYDEIIQLKSNFTIR